MVAPLILKVVALSVAKKVVVYLVAKQYGFRRLYRRISKFNHSVNRGSPILRERLHNQLQFSFRLPGEIYKLYRRVQRWGGVQLPVAARPAPTQATTTQSRPQKEQFRELHTKSIALRVSSPNVPNPSAFSGCSSFTAQSSSTHLLWRSGAGNQVSRSVARPFSTPLFPFGISALLSPTGNASWNFPTPTEGPVSKSFASFVSI